MATIGDYAIFAGGWASSPVDVVDIFDARTGEWSTAALSEVRSSVAGTSVGDMAMFGGGFTSGYSHSNVVDIFYVPEPATICMLSVGLPLLRLRKRRQEA